MSEQTPQPVPATPAASEPPATLTIQYDDFAKIQLKVATVLEAKLHSNADKLLVLQIDLGGERRQICAGIKAWYPPETLVGKQIIVVANLAPRPLRGEVSHGMLLAATDAATGNVVVLSPAVPVAPGSASSSSPISGLNVPLGCHVLRELHISNLAVISDARIEFAPGLNCFTGTTGAGKSLVIGAIELLLGLRPPNDMLRAGLAEGRVSGVFEISSKPLLADLERITDASLCGDGGELLLTRRIFSSGRSSVSLNGNPITLTMLRQMAETMIDVHGQHDHQFLLKPSNQLAVLDDFGRLEALREQYQAVWHRLTEARRELSALSESRSLRQQQLELHRFQIQEIDAAELQPGEYEELSARANVLQNLEKLKRDAAAVQGALYDVDGSVLERLKMMTAVLAELADLDATVLPIGQAVRDATLQLEEASFDLGRYLGRLELDPAELAEVNDRLNTINRLVKKYGDSVTDVLAYREQVAGSIAALEKQADDLGGLAESIAPLEAELRSIGDALTRGRRASAERLAPLIDRQLAELGMEKAVFTIQLTRLDAEPTAAGFDATEFIVQTNPGLAAQALRKIASGGELSRVMLALKSVLAGGERVSVLVFDEIDSNVGGRLGAVIGKKLRDLSRNHQVLCITHLPQIAAYADRHLTVRKSAARGTTETTVRVIAGPERIGELAEMIGGERITSTTRAQAQELLDNAVDSPRKPRGKATITR